MCNPWGTTSWVKIWMETRLKILFSAATKIRIQMLHKESRDKTSSGSNLASKVLHKHGGQYGGQRFMNKNFWEKSLKGKISRGKCPPAVKSVNLSSTRIFKLRNLSHLLLVFGHLYLLRYLLVFHYSCTEI